MASEMRERCGWKYDDIDNFYETQCGEGYCCNDGTINEHKIKFCPFCGGKIEQALDRLTREGVTG